MITMPQIRTVLVAIIFVLLTAFFLKQKQSEKLNWGLFYSFIWMLFSLPIGNYYCVKLDLWHFKEINSIKMPYDILFIWLFFWLLPFYIFKGKYLLILLASLLWIDLLAMPYIEKVEILKLNSNWVIGEFLLILLVFLPSYLWGKFSYEKKQLAIRALLQVATMSLFLTIVVPFSIKIYETGTFEFSSFSMLWFQIICIIAFPSFMGVIDLVEKGNGTPFPYDKTKLLVTTGVYAYIKNPIQWSFTILFIPLSIYHESYLLLSGVLISIAYTIGVSNGQEYEDMKERFGSKWNTYKKNVPSWYFQWKPKTFPEGIIYFKKDCNQCEGIKEWFEKQGSINLNIKYSENYTGKELTQVTYIHTSGEEYKSVKAIAHALEHIHLGYASIGWFMRFPVISFILQAIVDALGFSEDSENITCKINKKEI